MKVYIVNNGTTSILLTPENELEKMQLDRVFSAPAGVDIEMKEKVQMLNTALNDVVVITNKVKKDEQ